MDSRRRTNLRLIVMSYEEYKNDSNLEKILPTPIGAKRTTLKARRKFSKIRIAHIRKVCTKNRKHWKSRDTEF